MLAIGTANAFQRTSGILWFESKICHLSSSCMHAVHARTALVKRMPTDVVHVSAADESNQRD